MQVVIGKPQQVIGNEVRIPHVVGSAPEEVFIPIGGKIERLVKLLAVKVGSELQGVVALDLAEIVRRLEGVSELGQFAFQVVTEGKAARNGDKGHAFVAGAQVWSNAQARIIGIAETLVGRNAHAGVLHQVGPLRVEKSFLAFPKKGEAEFIHRGRSGSPGVRQIELLKAFVAQVAETRQGRAARLKLREGLLKIIIVEVIVRIELLVVRELLVDAHRSLVGAVALQRRGLVILHRRNWAGARTGSSNPRRWGQSTPPE